MIAENPERAAELLDQAFNRGDLEALLTFNDDNAMLVTAPDATARGAPALRSFFQKALTSGASATQLKTHSIPPAPRTPRHENSLQPLYFATGRRTVENID